MRSRGKLGILFLGMVLSLQLLTAQKQDSKKQKANISINMFSKASDISSGEWFGTVDEGKLYLQLMDAENRNNPSFIIHMPIPLNEFTVKTGVEGFELARESGSLVFQGSFPSRKGVGDFTFEADKTFVSFLEGQDIDLDEANSYSYFKLFLGDVTKEYVSGLKNRGYQPTLRELGKLGIHDVSLDYIDNLAKSGYKGLALDMIAKFAIHNITIKYINNLANAGYGNLDAQMLKKFAIHGVSVEYINGLSALGYGDLTPEMLKKFVVHNISLSYVKNLSAIGYGNLEPEMLKKFAIHNINADYIKSLKDTEINDPSPNTIKKAMIHNVTSNFIKRARKEGHNFDELSDYIRLKIRG